MYIQLYDYIYDTETLKRVKYVSSPVWIWNNFLCEICDKLLRIYNLCSREKVADIFLPALFMGGGGRFLYDDSPRQIYLIDFDNLKIKPFYKDYGSVWAVGTDCLCFIRGFNYFILHIDGTLIPIKKYTETLVQSIWLIDDKLFLVEESNVDVYDIFTGEAVTKFDTKGGFCFIEHYYNGICVIRTYDNVLRFYDLSSQKSIYETKMDGIKRWYGDKMYYLHDDQIKETTFDVLAGIPPK